MSSANLSLNTTAELDTGTKNFTPPGLNFTSTPGNFTKVNVPIGNATLTPPAGTNTILVVVPPTAATVTIKGVAADVGIPLVLSAAEIRWFMLPMNTPFVVNSTVAIPNVEVMYY